jgi:hypothetical protein
MTLEFDPVKALDHAITLGVAFAGVTAAFVLERYRIRRDERLRNMASLNKALYTVFNIWNVQEQLRRDVVEDWKDKQDAWFSMPATPPISYGITTFDANELTFVLQKDGELYSQLLLEEQRVASLIHLVEERSRVVLEEAWPRMAAAGYVMGSNVALPDVETALGLDVVRRLRVYTGAIIAHTQENLASLRLLHDRLRSFSKASFPNDKFLQVLFTEKPPVVQPPNISLQRDRVR